jgi:hypothetical protein
MLITLLSAVVRCSLHRIKLQMAVSARICIFLSQTKANPGEPLDDLPTTESLSDDRFEELDDQQETRPPPVIPQTPTIKSSPPNATSASDRTRVPTLTLTPTPPPNLVPISAPSRREFTWKTQERTDLSLSQIAYHYRVLEDATRSSTSPLQRRRLRARNTHHRCPGYRREVILLSSDVSKSAIVSHMTPRLREICPMCGEAVGEAETFRCGCGEAGE